jgi:hypothetical protein
MELWNTFDDIGAAKRSFSWKVERAEQLAAAIGGERPYRVGGCWVVRATRRNRELVGRYPMLFRSGFPGSSAAWVRSLVGGVEPPGEPCLIWCDVQTTRLFEWRQR